MIDTQHRRNDLLKTEISELDKAIEQILELEEQKERHDRAHGSHREAPASRPEVVKLFDQIVATLPEGVYLTSVKQSGRSSSSTASRSRARAYPRSCATSTHPRRCRRPTSR